MLKSAGKQGKITLKNVLGVGAVTDEEIALRGIGQTEILMDCAETAQDKMLYRVMNEAFTNLWKLIKSREDAEK